MGPDPLALARVTCEILKNPMRKYRSTELVRIALFHCGVNVTSAGCDGIMAGTCEFP